jgi:hypothetical protein
LKSGLYDLYRRRHWPDTYVRVFEVPLQRPDEGPVVIGWDKIKSYRAVAEGYTEIK